VNGPNRLVAELEELGHKPVSTDGAFIHFEFEVPLGPLTDSTIEVGFNVPSDYPVTPPTGIVVSPHLLPICSGGTHPYGGIHQAESGGVNNPAWQYWSRPVHDWHRSTQDASALMGHVRSLFKTLPEDLDLPNAA